LSRDPIHKILAKGFEDPIAVKDRIEVCRTIRLYIVRSLEKVTV
jgi:hypothetical protein